MNSILETIKPITLLSGSHRDTGITGSGCIMNVAAYLNGDELITDKTDCVHPKLRNLAIMVNDALEHKERQTLLPLISKLMGSANASKEIVAQWEMIQERILEDLVKVIEIAHISTPFLVLSIYWEHDKVSFFDSTAGVHAVLGMKERDLIEQHNMGALAYSTFKFWQARLHSWKHEVTTIQKQGLIDMLSLLPDEEVAPVVQGRATALATIAKTKAEFRKEMGYTTA